MPTGFVVPPMPDALVDALKRPYIPGGPNAMPQPIGAPPGGMPLNGRMGPTLPQSQNPGPLPTGQPLPATNPIRMGPGGVNLDKGNAPPGVGASGIPFSPMPSPPPTKLPAVTDDPGVTKNANTPPASTSGPMGAMPKTPDLGSYLNPALTRYNSDMTGYQQADQANRIDPQNVKPKLWERLLGFVAGATQLRNPENAGNVASEIVNRRRDQAEQNRSLALAPWTQRLQLDKEGVPLAESAARTANEQGHLDLDAAKENRERFSAQSNSEYKTAIAGIREEIAKGNMEKAENQLDQQQKALQEKKDKDAEWFQMQHSILDLRQQVEEHKEQKDNKTKPSQSVGIESRKASALQKAKTAYDRDTALAGNDPDARKTADDNFKQAQQDAQDAYEAEINSAGGEAGHQDVASWQKGSQATNAAPAAKAGEETLPSAVGPAGEKPVKTGNGGKYGYYASTKEWMVVPTSGGK